MENKGNFTLRIYGIILNKKMEILISDEYVLDTYMIKFPGGGLEFGEGTIDCLKREAREELNQEVEIISHYYTTDYYQKALYYEKHQLISIYYLAKLMGKPNFRISTKQFDFEKGINGSQSFRFVPIYDLINEPLTFPIDKKVAQKLPGDEKFLKNAFGY